MKTTRMKDYHDMPEDFSGIAEWPNGTKEWYLGGDLHRVDGPAIEQPDGTKEWYSNGQLHRVDGPAVEYFDGEKVWYSNGDLHRVGGPAIEWSDGTKQYWVHDKRIKDENAYWLLINMMRLKGLV